MATYQEQQQQRNRETKGVEEVVSSNSNQCCSSPPSNNTSSSSSSSPSHEFSFTISLNSHHHHHSSFINNNIFNSTKNNNNIDLSPADEIFFHGHLLPLHLFSSHLPQSPRSSTNSMDGFTLPIRDLLEDENPIKENSNNKEGIINNNNNNNRGNKFKPSLISLFGLKKGPKGSPKKEEKENLDKKKKRLNFDVIHAMKKYLRIVQQPLVLFRRRGSNNSRDKYRINGRKRSSYSYSSGNVTPNSHNNNKQDLFRGYWNSSAPASMITSPTNSGHLVATPTTLPSRDSTMEELQAAIQAAIAHCKNSIAKEEKKLKCSD
ncbi:hypothetical protein PIB30_031388 [Stylosanthes scabra]|uniref:BRI1 kinase inhibitor 1 n=1 Tax=Stylosanthes scabra TaxID=79078 RepID=A0ABU6YC75_9FABA|nr:hypothetical protein [Stylosanthes scabra]